jgi:predicted  nucleic acid-binding Zn-ribbon protein
METIITRDSDIIREYIGVLDARERSLSPFARLAATTKLSQLRDEIERNHLDITDDDLAGLRREIDQRLGRNFVRRFEAKRWGARVSAFLMVVLGSQLALALVLAATALFVRFVPLPGWWNKQLPHDEPAFLVAFVFVLFFTTPWLALLLVSGGRYFRAWRVTIPATIAIMLISGLGAYLVVRGKRNPILSQSSQFQFARERGVRSQSYSQWVDSKWLLRDPKFQADYEKFLRNGPGRWITSRFDAKDDAAWHSSLRVMGEYLDGGEDPNAIRDWLKYYLDKNRIYSEDRIEQEVGALTGPEDQRYLGIWEVEPFLKERDERLYSSYLGSINRAIKGWGLLEMGVMALAFLAAYVIWPRLGSLSPQSLVSRVREVRAGGGEHPTGASVRLPERRYRFPEQGDITTPPFFDTPFLILGRVHKSFLSLAVGTSLIVFLFFAAVYGLRLGGNQNVGSQVALMRSYIAFGGGNDAAGNQVQENTLAETGSAPGGIVPGGIAPEVPLAFSSVFGSGIGSGAAPAGSTDQVQILIARLTEIQQRLDDSEYENSKKLKDQGKLITAQAAEIGTLKGRLDQLQQTTMPLTQQVPDLSTRIGAVEDRAGQTSGDISAVKQQVDTLDKNLTTKIQEVEARATRASDQVGRVEEKASTIGTRTDALEKELDRRSRQLEARTEELGTRTADLTDKQEKLGRLEAASLDAAISEIAADTDDLDRKTKSAFYRFFNKAEARHNTEALAQRIKQFAEQLRQSQSKEIETYLTRLAGLTSRVEQIAGRLK